MVERDPSSDQIIINEQEQAQFDLPPVLSPLGAVRTAVAFNQVAIGLVERAATQDMSQRDGRQKMIELATRASELGGFAGRVLDLCPDEHLRVLLESDEI